MQISEPKSELSTLLTLSLVPYREMWDPGRRGLGDEVLTSAIEGALRTLPPLRDAWRLVWGPSRYDPRFSLFDDHLMYVAQNVTAPHRFVFVVRATNPRSLFDWLLADPWVTRMVPWNGSGESRSPVLADTPAISLSAALGLTILRNLRSHPLPTDPLTRLWRRMEDGTGEKVRRSGKRVATLVRGRGGRGLRAIQAPLPIDVRHLEGLDARRRENGVRDFLSWLASRSRRQLGPVARRVLEATERWGAVDPFDILAFLEGNSHLRHRVDPGTGSMPFLADILSRHETLDITVTGHGKGGTLAMLFALKLLETQAEGATSGWDPEKRATVRCVTFGAPPAGNGAFCRHAEAMFQGNLTMVRGDLDIVPALWSPGRALEALEFYAQHRPPEALEPLVRRLAGDLERLGYTTVSSAEIRLPGILPAQLDSYYQHAMFQHLEAYLESDVVGVDGAFDIRDLLSTAA